MKVIGNFSQTYRGTHEWSPGCDGKNRDFLIKAFVKNVNKIKCYNLIDYPTFSFHNFFNETEASELYSLLKQSIPKIKGYVYNNMSLGNCILTHLSMLKQQGVTDLLWIQDDEFFTHTSYEDFVYFIDYYKNTEDIKHVSLLHPRNEIVNAAPFSVRSIPQTELEITTFTSAELRKDRTYSMDFTSFICNIDYFLNNMFDANFVNLLDAYQLEGAVLQKSVVNNVERSFLNINFFESFNIVGMGGSLSRSEERYKKLKEMNLI